MGLNGVVRGKDPDVLLADGTVLRRSSSASSKQSVPARCFAQSAHGSGAARTSRALLAAGTHRSNGRTASES